MTLLKQYWLLIILTLLGSFFFFYNLTWGAPFYFHPDERNVASAVSQLQFPNQLNPNFFAYGSLPIYTVFFTGLFANYILSFFSQLYSPTISFEQAIIIGRIYSALFATVMIPFLYLLAKKMTHSHRAGMLAAFLATTSVGFIQFAHFGTFEMWLTFFSVALFWVCLLLIERRKMIYVFLLGVIFGVLFAIKISSLALLPIPLIALAIAYPPHQFFRKKQNNANVTRKMQVRAFFLFIASIFCFSGITGLLYALTNPFVILDTEAFLSSIRYESSVGFNTLPVFYTQGFYDTTPVLYQLLHVYPFLLNPVVTILIVPSFVYIIWHTWRTKNAQLFLLVLFFLVLFLSQALLFIKWTRYMIPTLPFIYLIIAIIVTMFLSRKSLLSNTAVNVSLGTIVIINSIFSLSYFITAFAQQDTRMAALNYAKDRIPETTPILSEVYDIGITAFNPAFQNIILFNTYDLDGGSPDFNKATWQTAIEGTEYIILPSQRVMQTRIQNPKRFPVGNEVYSSLINGTSGYVKIYETPCDIFCQITYLGDPVFRYEQTASVFDRPTVYIFQKKH